MLLCTPRGFGDALPVTPRRAANALAVMLTRKRKA